MKKLFNIRYMFIYFIAAILGVVVSRAISYFSNFDSLILISFAFVAINILILSIVFGKKYAGVFLQIVNCCLVFFMAVASTLSYTSWLNKDLQKFDEGNYTIIGKIVEVDYVDAILYLDDVKIEEVDESLNGEVKLYLYDEEVVDKIVRGDKIRLKCNLKRRDINSRFSASNQTVVAFVRDIDSVEIEESKGLKDKFKRRVWEILGETNSSESTRQIEFAMLFGDKDRMGEDTQSVYSETGLAHILAVSGLHIGFVVSIIYTLIKKLLKNKHWTTLIVTSVFIILYLYLCDFAISAVRAVLMTMVVLYAKARGKQYDPLCGLSLAGILILLVHPFDFFNVGFQLSFAVVYSLFCLSPPIEAVFSKFMPAKLAGTLAVCTSTFIGSILIVAYYFNNCSLLAIFSNLIIIPVVSISFTLLFVFAILASIISPLKFLVEIPNLLFECINTIVYSISELGISAVLFSTNVIGVVLGLIAIFILSDYIFLSKKQKAVVVSIIVCFIGMTVVYSNYRILEQMAEVSHYEIY